MSLLSQYMPSVMQMGMRIYSWMHWLIIIQITRQFSLTDQQITAWGRPVTHKTTAGWQICCQWKDASTSWENLSKIKESDPVHIAKFAVAQVIDHEPAVNWWVKHALK